MDRQCVVVCCQVEPYYRRGDGGMHGLYPFCPPRDEYASRMPYYCVPPSPFSMDSDRGDRMFVPEPNDYPFRYNRPGPSGYLDDGPPPPAWKERELPFLLGQGFTQPNGHDYLPLREPASTSSSSGGQLPASPSESSFTLREGGNQQQMSGELSSAEPFQLPPDVVHEETVVTTDSNTNCSSRDATLTPPLGPQLMQEGGSRSGVSPPGSRDDLDLSGLGQGQGQQRSVWNFCKAGPASTAQAQQGKDSRASSYPILHASLTGDEERMQAAMRRASVYGGGEEASLLTPTTQRSKAHHPWADDHNGASPLESSSTSSEDNMRGDNSGPSTIRGDNSGAKVIVQSQQTSDLSQLTCNSSMHDFPGSLHSRAEMDKKACYVHTLNMGADAQRQVTGCV